MNDYFKGKKAFITGSSRGLGRETALALAKQGCDLLLHYRKDQEAAQKTLEEVKQLGVQGWLYQGDLCDLEQTQNFLKTLKEEHDSLDFYIANAASTSFKAISDLNPGNVSKTFNLVVQSFIATVQELIPLLRGRSSHIMAISGIDTVQYCPGHGLLAAAKSSLETLCKYLSVELAGEKIHVKAFNPGLIATDSTRFYMGEAFDAICKQANQVAPWGGFKEPQEVADVILYLLQPESHWMATQTLHADGGLSFMLPTNKF